MIIEIRARVMGNNFIAFDFHSRKFRVIVTENGEMCTDDYECYSFPIDKFNDEIRRVFKYTGADEIQVLWENGNDIGWGFKKEIFIS